MVYQRVLGIESSCDESAAAVVLDGRKVLSNVVFSQVELHRPYGGVVPEIASRSHVEKLPGVVRRAVAQAFGDDGGGEPGVASWRAIDAVAVTYGPGLASSLIVGLNMAKGLAQSLGVPLIGVNHLEAHIHSVFLGREATLVESSLPLLALVVSGGHTCWVEVERYGEYKVIGQTLDDAAGEAFDKAAKLLGLGYPGGPEIDRVARLAEGRREITFPRGRPRAGVAALGGLQAELCASFSGLKTALMYYLRDNPPEGDGGVAEVAAAYQEAIVGALAERTRLALAGGRYRALAVGGGVSLNRSLRERLQGVAAVAGVELLLAAPEFCGDNAAMIAGLAGYGVGVPSEVAMGVDVVPALEVGEVVA